MITLFRQASTRLSRAHFAAPITDIMSNRQIVSPHVTTLHSPSRIHLTKEVAERLRGSYVIEYGAQPGSATDIVEADDSILAEGVIVAPDGWLRAFVSFNTFENTFVRVEFLIPLAGVIAIASEFRATGRELNQANDPKAKLLDEIEHSWKTSAGSGARG